jgi:hypothetical protein
MKRTVRRHLRLPKSHAARSGQTTGSEIETS